MWDHAEKLIACELLTPPGNWSSYPPHKHDASDPCPVVNEEIYYYRIAGRDQVTPSRDGFGYHRTYTGPEHEEAGLAALDETLEVRDHDVVLVPHGYHGPCMAAPGYPMYYLNVMAGPRGTVDGVLRRPATLGPRHDRPTRPVPGPRAGRRRWPQRGEAHDGDGPPHHRAGAGPLDARAALASCSTAPRCRCSPGVFAIFGHGNVLGLGTALHDVRDQLPTWRGQTEQGMALAAVAYARAMDRRQVMVATTLRRARARSTW